MNEFQADLQADLNKEERAQLEEEAKETGITVKELLESFKVQEQDDSWLEKAEQF